MQCPAGLVIAPCVPTELGAVNRRTDFIAAISLAGQLRIRCPA
jgi:hypothetical protein